VFFRFSPNLKPKKEKENNNLNTNQNKMRTTKGGDKDCIKEIKKMRPWLCREEKLVACN
jgi:hypothetical protein